MIVRAHHRRLLIVTYLVALLGVTLLPMPGPVYPPSGLDKFVHFLLFGGLALLTYWNLAPQSEAKRAATAILAGVAAAGCIELMQGLLPYRASDILDLVAGAVGALGGAMVGYVCRGRLEPGVDS